VNKLIVFDTALLYVWYINKKILLSAALTASFVLGAIGAFALSNVQVGSAMTIYPTGGTDGGCPYYCSKVF
jgi:hypothetical protein